MQIISLIASLVSALIMIVGFILQVRIIRKLLKEMKKLSDAQNKLISQANTSGA